MDKTTFLEELTQALSVLQTDELKDIISEYEQHIDMKIENGLPEEEAIADFGSLEELTAEILEAYHVRADYAGRGKKEGGYSPYGGERAKKVWECAVKGVRQSGRSAAQRIRRLGHLLWAELLLLGTHLARPLHRLKAFLRARNVLESQRGNAPESALTAGTELLAAVGQSGSAALTAEQRRMIPEQDAKRIRAGLGREPRPSVRRRGAFAALIHGTVRSGTAVLWVCGAAVKWCVGMAWNAFWLGNVLFCSLFGLLGLFGLGILMVLLFQNYPLIGVTVGCLGTVMCLFSAAWLSLTFLWRPSHERRGNSDINQASGTGGNPAGDEEGNTVNEEMRGGEYA